MKQFKSEDKGLDKKNNKGKRKSKEVNCGISGSAAPSLPDLAFAQLQGGAGS